MSIEPIVLALNARKEKKVAIDLMEALYRHAFHYEEYDDLAKSAFKIKEYILAIKYGEDALTNALTNEKMWTARANLINVYNHANYPEKAMRIIKAQESVIPDDSETRLEKAFSYFLLNQKDDAEKILQEELTRTDLPEETKTRIRFNLGTYFLYRDEFLKGLELFQFEGQKLEYWKKPKLDGVFWNGQEVPQGTNILVYAEAGIGDEIINIRFLKHLKERGMNPIWYSDRKDISEIFSHSGFQVINNMRDRPKDSIWTYSMTLPVFLKLDYKDLWYGPYIKSEPEYTKKYEYIKKQKKNIGIRWQGNPEYDQDLHRSVPLCDIMSAIDTSNDDTTLVSLQRDTGLNELEQFPIIQDMSSKMTNFHETLGIIDNLDVVITSCTSVAHMAAALGKRTFIFIPISAYYIWSHSMEQSPWYGDNVTLLRQEKPRCWKAPIEKLKNFLG